MYHGWKFDIDGTASTCPTSPPSPTSNRRSRRPPIAAPTRAASPGSTWAPTRPTRRGLPQWEWCQVPENQLQHSHKAIYQCNFMQALEGELDTTHVYFLHSRLDPKDAPSYGLYAPDRRARLEIVDTNYGVMYGARRSRRSRRRVLLAHHAVPLPDLRHVPGRRRGRHACRSRSTCRSTTSTRCTGACGGIRASRWRALASRSSRSSTTRAR